MKVFCSAGSMRGNKSVNQDRFCIDDRVLSFDTPRISCECKMPLSEESFHVVAVADGVTNSLNGGRAAEIVVELICNAYKESRFNNEVENDFKEKIDEMMNEAASEIRWEFRNHENDVSASTTISIIVFNADKVWAYNLGDSPIYVIREGNYIPLFNEDTVGAEKIKENERKGIISSFFRKSTVSERDFNCLTKCVSGDSYNLDGNISTSDFMESDVLLISSDGLFKALSKEDIVAATDATSLIHKAERNYADDDVTVVLIRKEKCVDYDANKVNG